MNDWWFAIDVGGTFTDVVATRPDGTTCTYKLLSTGCHRGVVAHNSAREFIRDPRRIGEPQALWVGYTLRLQGSVPARVVDFDEREGLLGLESPLPFSPTEGASYELTGGEEAPVAAIRYLMGLSLADAIGPVEVRLGTTRATNALLERKGARVLFVTTRGFGDILRIGYQDRPELFALNIRKRDELYEAALEVDERLRAGGEVLRKLDGAAVREQLAPFLQKGLEAVAVCLLHAHLNPVHEEIIADVCAELGFLHVSVSSRISRLERIVPRSDTTVLDAYLGRIIQGYVASLRRCLPEAHIRLMTSWGGLVPAEQTRGKDTLLSGPAGGVVGCARTAREAGIGKAIGFDMGGTSTDVSRIDGPLEYQHETVKAGVRLMTPMLAVETVAAGGGSICAFDGQKLTVGPHSAGADPGPACYGRGGPLTVTDINVFLGRVPPSRFPFPLDRGVVESKLDALRAEIGRSTSSTLTSVEVAEGFLRIANAHMTAAIKRISIAKGYDLRDYTLVSFGGAGGQHACAVARMLGIRKILLSPFAGVLSAFGVGVADVQRIGQRSVHIPLDSESAVALQPLFQELERDLRDVLLREGVAEEALAPASRQVDLCYLGQSTFLTVEAEPLADARTRFERLHQQLYGYGHQNRVVEIRVVRVGLRATAEGKEPTAFGTPRAVPFGTEPVPAPMSTTMEWANAVFDGEPQETRLFDRGGLRPGDSVQGPAIISEAYSTIVVEPGWEAKMIHTGDLLLADQQAAARTDAISTAVDPIQLELFNNRFAAVAEQMGATLRRTALSVNVKERLDFSCAVFDSAGNLVVNAPHIPVHLGGMSDCVKALIEDVPDFHRGDVYVTNDPYRGGSHLNDVTVITPVHAEAARLLFFVASRAHHAEIGGTRPGSMPPDSTSLAEEGVLIRTFALIRNGQERYDEFRTILTTGPYPSRAPDENVADLAAQVAANQTGVRALRELVATYGTEVVQAYMSHIQRGAEEKMRKALSKLEPGIHRFDDTMDDGSAIHLALTIHPAAGGSVHSAFRRFGLSAIPESARVSSRGLLATFDFTGTAPVLRGNLNANRSIVTSALLYCLRCLIDEDIPLNAGVLSPVEVILPECFLNPRAAGDPRDCPAVVGGNVETSQRIVDMVFGALQTVAASQGTMNNLLMGNDRFGYYETVCGGAGAGPGFHGADAVHTHMTNTRLTDPEILESRYPVRLIRFAIRLGSGGAGRFRGGCGVIRELEFLEPLDVSILSQRRTKAPYGLGGGCPGQSGRNVLRQAGSLENHVLPAIVHLCVNPGDRLIIETPGGGGYGSPL